MVKVQMGGMLENRRDWVRYRPEQKGTWIVPEGDKVTCEK